MSRFDPFTRGRESPPAARLTRRAFAAAFPMALIPGTTAAGRNQATPAATPLASPSAMGPSLHVEPTTVRFDERFDVWLTGLEPGEEVTVASSFENYGIGLSAEATFAADQDGVVDLASREPLDGTWRVPDTMGLIWSARRSGRYLPHMVGTERITITASIADEVIGEKAIERSILPEDRGPEYIFGDDMVADWFPPAADATRPLPAVIVLGGSDGGLSPYSSVIAALLASRGYAALSLAYFGIGALPPSLTEIPLEYFGTAIH
jgi:hypothetical protein